MTEALKKIDKSTWVKHRFDEIAMMVSERVDPNNTDLEIYVGLEHLESENLHIRSHGTPDDVNGTKLRFYEGDVIFGRRRAYQRKAAIAEYDGFCSAHAMVLRAKPDVIDPALFPFFLHSDQFMHRAVDISVGSLSPTINWKTLRKQEFLLPPKPEQARLAELLWAGDEVLEGLERVDENLEVLRNSSRKSLFRYGTGDPKSITLTRRKSGLTNIKWSEKRFSEVTKIKSGQVDPSSEEYCDLIQIGSERIGKNDGKILEFKTAKELNINSGNYQFSKGDVLYSKIRPYFKKVAMPDFDGLCSADIYPIRPGKELESNFLKHFLLTEMFTQKILRFQNRTGMPKVNRDELNSIYVPIPDIDEQIEICKRLDQVDCQLDQVHKSIDSTKSLQKSLINQIF